MEFRLMLAVYYFFRAFSWLVSRLPMPFIYLAADLLYVLFRYIIRYRRAIILHNLQSSFPEYDTARIRRIMNRFYRNIADISLEVIKLQNIKKEELLRRFHFTGYEMMQRSFDQGRSVIVTIGHCGNWEWMGTALGLISSVKGYAVVKPLSNKYFDRHMEMLRHKLNADSTIPFRHTFRIMARNRKEFQTFNVIAADQTPLKGEIHYWHPFLNQETAFFQGPEKLAKALDFDVVYIDTIRTGRGTYSGKIVLISSDPKNTGPNEITDTYIRLLEDSIRQNPDNWLWSHRRWKHKKEQ